MKTTLNRRFETDINVGSRKWGIDYYEQSWFDFV